MLITIGGHRGRDSMVVGLKPPVQSVPISKKPPVQSVPISIVVSLNPAYCEVYSIQLFVIKFVSNFRSVNGFLSVFRFPPPIKLTTMI